MTRFVPLKFKHLPVSDHIPSRIAKHIKHRVYQSQFEYINKKDFPARNPNCNFKLMEASLFNSAKILKMELSQRAFFINLQVPHSMISSEELTGQQLEVISSKIRMIRINTKSRVPVALQDIDEEIYLEFCIYDVENFYPSTFSQIQRFKMRYTQTGDLEQYATTEQEPCIER